MKYDGNPVNEQPIYLVIIWVKDYFGDFQYFPLKKYQKHKRVRTLISGKENNIED